MGRERGYLVTMRATGASWSAVADVALVANSLAAGATGVDLTLTGLAKAARLWASALGSAAAPAVAIGDGDSGLYESGDDTVAFSSAGNVPGFWAGTGLNLLGPLGVAGALSMGVGAQILADYGTTALPGYAFNGRPSHGIRSAGPSTMNLVVNNNTPVSFVDSGSYFNSTTFYGSVSMGPGARILADFGTGALPGYGFNGDASGIYRNAPNSFGFAISGGNIMSLDGTLLIVNTAAGGYLGAGYWHLQERAAPGGVADRVALFARDNGGGKTQCVIRCGAAGTEFILGVEA